MRLIFALIASLWITGCASQPYSAVAADAATTATGLSIAADTAGRKIIEGNPLGWWTVPIRIAIIEHAKTMPIEEGTPVLHMTSAVGWGAAANNLLVMAGVGPFALAAGVMVAIGIWADGENERNFWENCATHRRLEPEKDLTCVWTKA
jgi:hypothetical protein